MATFRRTHCLAETVRQLLTAQTRAPFELIVVNNDPEPGAEQAVRAVLPDDPRVRVTTCPTGRQGACRNHGLALATGDYVAFVDDDDDYAPEYIEKLAEALDGGLRSVRCQIQTCGFAGPDCNGKPTRALHPLTPNTMARRDALTETWNDPPNEDRDYWARHPIEGTIDECLVITCHGPGQHSPRNQAQGGSWRVRFAIMMQVSDDDAPHLAATVASLRAQSYGHWTCTLLDQSRTASVQSAIERIVAEDTRLSVRRPSQPCTDALARATGEGQLVLRDDDVLLVLHGNERLAHAGVLNRLAHVYAEHDEVWMTFGACSTEPFTPAWPQASFPPALWEARRFRAAPTLIGEYAPLTLRAAFVQSLQSVLTSADTAAPSGARVEDDECDLALFVAALEAAGASHAYQMAETQVIKRLEKPAFRDAARRRDALTQQLAVRARAPLAPIVRLRAGVNATASALAVKARVESPVAWYGPVYDPSGYGNEVRNFVLALADVHTRPILRAVGHHSDAFRETVGDQARTRLDAMLAQPMVRDTIGIVHLPPSFMQRVPGAQYMIGRTMFETDGLSPDLVERCNQMDELWVPSAFNEATFRAAGVHARLVRMPGAVDSERFRPGLSPFPIPNTRGTVFLSTIEWKPRKGWQTLVRAWADAFGASDDVTLVFRASIPGRTEDDCAPEIFRQIDACLAEYGRSRRDVAPIVVLGRQVADADIPHLYAAATVYVAPSSGEGWGYPYMEAMASGLLTIATRWSGNLEFMNDDNSLLCDVDTLIPAIDEYVGPMPGQQWAQPSVSHLTQLLRVAIDDPSRASRLAARARDDISTTWHWRNVAARVAARLSEIAREQAAVSVHWEGPVFTHSSLGLVNREMTAALLARGVDVSLAPTQADDFVPSLGTPFAELARRIAHAPERTAAVHVAHQWPPRLTPPAEGAWVLMQPWEYGGLPGEWIPTIRDQVDEFWVYCSWQRECAIASGVPADKVVVVPIGVDPSRYRPDGDRFVLKTRKRTKLLAVGGIIPRKGMDLLVDTYLRTFSAADDVCLVIKGLSARWAYQGNPGQSDFAQLPALVRSGGGPEIEFIGDTLDDDAVASLYRACDALVAPFRGEGFGLPIVEAMASGVPVIVTEAGPVFDICDEHAAYLIPAGQSTPDPRLVGLEPGALDFWWADPDVQELGRLMRHVVEHPEEARAVGTRGRDRVLQRFTYAHGADVAHRRLRALASRAPIRVVPPAVFGPEVPPFPLDQPRSVVFLHQASWRTDEWKRVVRAYLRAFGQDHDVSLVLTLDPAQGFGEERVVQALSELRAEVGLSAAGVEAPDMLLVTDDLNDGVIAALMQASGCVVAGAADVAGRSRARAVGKPVLETLGVDAWHAAATAIAGDAWQQMPALAPA